jgi:crotonobetainyl-CoA:carnitine CoA-transferase CaiB-like acyl-CoA transferase
MNLLHGQVVLALEAAADSALARLLASFGAAVERVALPELAVRLAHADLLLDQVGTEVLAEAGYSRAQLEAACPTLIHVSVTPFGSGGPHGRWRGSELVASAMGGTLRVTGDPDRPPVKEALDACCFHADMAAAAGAMAALHERGVTGRGQHVDVSVQEVAFSRNVNGILAWQFDRRKLHRVGGALNYGRATVRCIWPLADGFCFHTLMTGRFGAPANQALSDWMDEAGLDNPLRGTNWETYNRSTLDPAIRAQWEVAIEAFFRTRTKAQIRTEGQRRGLNATVVAEPADVLADPHLQAREFWSGDSTERRPSRFVRIRQASAAGELRSRVPASVGAAVSGPLHGVRVLDFSWALVGSITTKILGDLGCDVVKVESRGRPCLSRLDVQVAASRPDSFDDKPWFAHLNTSKRSLALDLKMSASREVLDPLIEWADVVVENFSPGTMTKLGLDYDRLARRNPGIVMVSGSVFGQTGPLAQTWGVDGTGAALSGRTFLTGWTDRDPVIPGAVPYGDVIVPYVMAAAAAAALEHRSRTGAGCHIDAAMYEICVQQMQAAIIAAAAGERPMRSGNTDARVFHQGVYPASGIDRWVAITVHEPDEWGRLVAALHLAEAVTPVQRHAVLREWTQRRTDSAAVAALQALGIAAGVVQDIEDMIEHDAQLAQRQALIVLDHALLGPFGHVRTPIDFSRSAVRALRAPSLGEHSREIALDICRLSPERITALESLGVFR